MTTTLRLANGLNNRILALHSRMFLLGLARSAGRVSERKYQSATRTLEGKLSRLLDRSYFVEKEL